MKCNTFLYIPKTHFGNVFDTKIKKWEINTQRDLWSNYFRIDDSFFLSLQNINDLISVGIIFSQSQISLKAVFFF